jgi:hypothetical protein
VLSNYTQPDLPRAALELVQLYAARYVRWPHELPPALQALIMLPISSLALLGAWAERRAWPAALLLLLAFAIGVPLLAYATGLVGRPVWRERVILWSVPFGLILIAAEISAVRGARRRALVLSLVLAVQATNLAGYYAVQRREPYDRVARDLAASFAPGDAILVFPYDIHDPFAYYARRVGLPESDYILLVPDLVAPPVAYPHGLPPGYPRVETVDRGAAHVGSLSELRAVAARHRRLWVLGQYLEENDPRGAVAASLGSLGRIVDHRVYEPRVELLLVEVR